MLKFLSKHFDQKTIAREWLIFVFALFFGFVIAPLFVWFTGGDHRYVFPYVYAQWLTDGFLFYFFALGYFLVQIPRLIFWILKSIFWAVKTIRN